MKKIFKKENKIRKLLLQNLYSWEITQIKENNINYQNEKKINKDKLKIYLNKIIEKNEILNLIIKTYSNNIQNINLIDKIILKIAIFELLFKKYSQKKVIINESIELSKKFSNKKSYMIINKLIDKIIKYI